jgi:hypothetical protein
MQVGDADLVAEQKSLRAKHQQHMDVEPNRADLSDTGEG